MIIEEIKQIKYTSKDIINFGLLIGGIVALIGIVTLFYGKPYFMYLIPGGMVIMAVGFITPKLLTPIYFFWMALSVVLGYISTRVILFLLYYLIILPIGLLFKMMKKDLLDTKFEQEAISYWIERPKTTYEKEETERQF